MAAPASERIIGLMQRLRILGAMLGCLAVLVAGLSASAFAWTPSSVAGTTQKISPMAAGEPCSHCPDCDGCPDAGMFACVVACFGALPTLPVASFDLPAARPVEASGPLQATVLHGQSRPPDPFPPRR